MAIYSKNRSRIVNPQNKLNQSNMYIMAISNIRGGPLAPQINGTVFFKNVIGGVEVYVNICGLPRYQPGNKNKKPIGPHGFHIHEIGSCVLGDEDNPFASAGGHWNPTNQPHGNHAGDFPVLFSNNGISRMIFFTNKFYVKDIIDKSIIIHESPDDYQTQPSGDSGGRIACGVIKGINNFCGW